MFTKLLNALSLLDNKGEKLSLTNIALIVCVVKVAMAPNVSFAEISALLLALLNYSYKRHVSNSAEQAEATNSKEVAIAQANGANELSSQVTELTNKLNDHEKIFNEAKDIVNVSRLNIRR